MTAGELICRVDELRPNGFSHEQKLAWLRRADGHIREELLEQPTPPVPAPAGAGGLTPLGDILGTGAWAAAPIGGEAPAAPDPEQPGGEVAPLEAQYQDETELLAPFPWGDALYEAWLFCQIDLHNGEIGRYAQSLSLLQTAWRSLADAIRRRSAPPRERSWRF